VHHTCRWYQQPLSAQNDDLLAQECLCISPCLSACAPSLSFPLSLPHTCRWFQKPATNQNDDSFKLLTLHISLSFSICSLSLLPLSVARSSNIPGDMRTKECFSAKSTSHMAWGVCSKRSYCEVVSWLCQGAKRLWMHSTVLYVFLSLDMSFYLTTDSGYLKDVEELKRETCFLLTCK